MSKKTWADVQKGDTVELGGKRYAVRKIKHDGKRAKVVVTLGGAEYRSEVKRKDAVTIIPLHDESGAQTRWSKPDEDDAGLSLPPGVAQRNVEKILGATLVAGTEDGGQTWKVTEPDVATVASHMMIFHGIDPSTVAGGEKAMLEHHVKAHRMAEDGDLFLHVAHTHGKVRR